MEQVVRTTASCIKPAVFVLLLAIAAAAHAQTTDINLNRLAEAVNAINENQLPHAEELLNSVLATSANDADALNLLGVVRAKQDRVADAERLFRRALASSPSHAGAHINLATLYAAKNDYARVYEHLHLVPRKAFNDNYFLLMLRALVGLNKTNEVRDLLRQFQESNSGNLEMRAEFATLLVKVGFADDALNILNAVPETSNSFAFAYACGIVYSALKQYDKAEEYLTSALKLKPDDVATLRALAKLSRANGNLEKALSHLVQARRIAPDSPGVLYDFGATALQMGLVLDALPVFERLHRDYPHEPAYLYGLAAAHWTKGDVADTTRLLNEYAALQPREASGWYLLGAALLRQERTAEAQTALQRSLSLKSDPDTEYLLGVTFEKLGNRAAAMEKFRKIVQSRPDHAAAHAALGTAYREAGSYAEARTELERAVELDANDLRANYQLGLVYAKLGEKEAAQKMFDRADALRKQQHEQERVVLKLIDAPQP